jgi:transposase
MDTPPEQVTPSQQPTEPGHRSPAPTPLCRLPDPSEVVIAAPKPAMPIAKGLPGPGLLAHLIVSKYTDHLPLHRLERIYERQGLFLHRSTLCDWLAACADLLRPLYDLLVRVVLQSRALRRRLAPGTIPAVPYNFPQRQRHHTERSTNGQTQ